MDRGVKEEGRAQTEDPSKHINVLLMCVGGILPHVCVASGSPAVRTLVQILHGSSQGTWAEGGVDSFSSSDTTD